MPNIRFAAIFAVSFCFTFCKARSSRLLFGERKLLRRISALHVHSPSNTQADNLLVSDHQGPISAIDGSSHPPLDTTLPGKYVSLANITDSFPPGIGFDMESCPDSVEILNVSSVSNEGPSVYEVDYSSGLRVDNQACFSLPGAATALKLYPTSSIPETNGDKGFPIWVGLIPDHTVQCGPEPAPKVTLSILPVESLLDSFSLPTSPMSIGKAMQTPSNFSLVVSLRNSVCPYFTESNIEFVTALIHKYLKENSGVSPTQHGDIPRSTAMDPENILHSHFELRQLCPCTSHFPKIVSFLPALTDEDDSEVDMNKSKEMNRAIVHQDSVDEHDDANNEEATYIPMPIKWNGNLCPSKRIYTIGEVVSYDEKMYDAGIMKRLMLHGVVEKLFDEVRDELSHNSSAKFSFEAKRMLLMKFGEGLEGMRGVIPFRRGSKCGGQNITEDFVMLFEVYHILHQLSNNLKKRVEDKAKWEEILNAEIMSVESATLHVFALQTSSDLDVCTYTASLRTRELLVGNCDSFVPLGRRDPEKIPDEENNTVPSPKPAKSDHANADDTNQGDENEDDTEDDKSKKSIPSPGASPSAGSRDSEREAFQPGSQDAAQTVSPSATPSPIFPTVTPSASFVASPTLSSSVKPKETMESSPLSSPSPSSTQVTPSISVTPSPSSSPASSSPNSTETDDSESACFPGATKVILEDRSLISMMELRVGDYIVDGSGELSRVLAFAHANPEVENFFVLIKFPGGELPISAQHYLPINGKLATAKSVKPGDFINISEPHQSGIEFSQPAQVSGVERISLMGLYNPQTASGSIAVVWKGSAVVASTYTKAVDPAVAHLIMWPLRGLDRIAGIVIPLFANVLRDGSIFWKRLLPEGSTKLQL